MQYHDAKLLATAANTEQWPESSLTEIIFVGRSNAGKSTLINTLVNRRNLAYSGKTPGKTRLLNFFLIDRIVVFTDAPGYGYAIRDTESAKKFSRLIDPYFKYRKQLKGMILVADARREPSKDDIAMIEYGRAAHLNITVACTKADKLSRSQLLRNMKVIRETLGVSADALIACSSVEKTGMEELWARIDSMILTDAL